MVDRLPSPELLRTVVELDHSLWGGPGSTTLAQRNTSVRAALAGGWTASDVADRLGVLPVDVTRWAQNASVA